MPRPADAFQALQHTGWILGVAKPPRFDRWTYWEKFDYWAVFWGMVIIGGTGLILFDAVVTSRFMPGWGINVALWIHRIEALLAMGHVFIIHFFIAHLRRSNFPMDRVMFEGGIDIEFARHEKPAWVDRQEQNGLPEWEKPAVTGRLRTIVFYLFGFAVVAFGVFLLIGGILNSPIITW